ncbi:ABC transporter ATP-binding protein [Leifsonia sp. LS1]|uniref:ABC transporter ATP-binding protein n=1 Tax=Leifsonia sp. LS1 TaxID=2828483 RepID=UPI001CFE3D4D|nr:ABC transporter ATP-binding protein [Leifsonia sp. LS1]
MDGISFEVPTGSLFAFLGSNGAGKSTTIGCITTTIAPSSGTITINGLDVQSEANEVRRQIGAVFQSSLLDPMLTVNENLMLRAGFYGFGRRAAAARVEELTPLVGLGGFLGRRYGLLSGGQKRRADIARALIHRPSVLFLDEPTAGLDPQSREQIWSAVNGLRAAGGTTVFLTTHYMEETERADQVCVIDRGEIVAEGTPSELRSRFSRSVLTIRTTRPDEVERICREYRITGMRHDGAGEVVIPVDSAAQARDLLTVVPADDFEFRHGTMDDVFLAVTKEIAA